MTTFADYEIDIRGGTRGEVRTTCPECSPTRRKKNEKCLAVNVDKETWHCQHCGYSGGLKKMKQDYQASSQKTYTKPTRKISTELPDKVVGWFSERGISENVLKRNKIGHGNTYMPQVEKEVSAIHFPYYDGPTLINCKHRDGNKNFCMEKGAERILYGLNDIDKDLTVIVEGEIDKLSCDEAGFDKTVSVPDGAPSPNTKNYSSKFSFLESAEDKLTGVKRFIIAVDNDPPGIRLRDELARRLGVERCYYVEWPAGSKDANDVLVKHGPEQLTKSLNAAKPVPVKGIFTVSDIRQKVQEIYQFGFPMGVTTGWCTLDPHYTIRPGELSIVTGIPGAGKSELLDALSVNLALEHDWGFGICSMENYPIERHWTKFAEKYTSVPFREGPTARMTESQLDQALEWSDNYFFFIMPNESELTVENILQKAKVLVYRHGIKGLVIDPWNELDHSRPDGMTETEYISQSLTKVRRFARENDVHVWLVAHPTKLRRLDNGSYPVPTPYDISGSAHWRNKADNALAIWRDTSEFNNPLVQIHIQKIRFKEIGRPGMVELKYNIITGTYREVA